MPAQCDYITVNIMPENVEIKAKFLDKSSLQLNYPETRSPDEFNMSCIVLGAAHIKLLAFWLMRSHTQA